MTISVLSKYRSILMGIAMIMVLLFHAVNNGLSFGFTPLNQICGLGFGAVDIFIFLSAMGITVSQEKNESSYGSYLIKRIVRIVPAYFIVMIPYTVLQIIFENATIFTLIYNSTFIYYFVNDPYRFNWYISGIMMFYLVAPFIIKVMKDTQRRIIITLLGILFGICLSQALSWTGYWRYVDVAYRIPIFFLGILFGFFVLENRRISRKGAAFTTLVGMVGIAYIYWSYIKDGMIGSHYIPIAHGFILTTIPCLLCICFIIERMPINRFWKGLGLIGDCSLEIYLLNVSFFSRIDVISRIIDLSPHRRLLFLVLIPCNILLGMGLHIVIRMLTKKRKKTKRSFAQ